MGGGILLPSPILKKENMTYCTYSDVANEFKSLSFSSGTIGSDEVSGFISQEEAIINGRLKKLYTTPITASDDLLIVKCISIWKTAQRVGDILKVQSGSSKIKQETKSLGDKAEELLKSIINQDILLTGSARNNATGGVDDYNSNNDVEPQFESETEQW